MRIRRLGSFLIVLSAVLVTTCTIRDARAMTTGSAPKICTDSGFSSGQLSSMFNVFGER